MARTIGHAWLVRETFPKTGFSTAFDEFVIFFTNSFNCIGPGVGVNVRPT
jgi:hypothetical protein